EKYQEETQSNEDILEDPDTWQDLQLSAEKAKKILSQRSKTPVSITHGGERVKIVLEREKFEELTADLVERTIDFTRDMLSAARGKGYTSFDEIILVGGSTRMPQIHERIQQEFSVAPKVFDPDEAVAKGASIYGWKLSLNDGLIQRLAEKSQKSVEEFTNLPEMIETREVKPEEFRAAAQEVADDTGYTLPTIQSAMLKVKNVSSKSFGVVAHNPSGDEIVFNLVVRNTAVPVKRMKNFYTAVKNQQTVLIRIMESETNDVEIPLENAVEINTAVLTLPPNLPADLPIEITFSLNEEGRLHITAMETSQSRQVEVMLDTASVIQGEAFEKAKARSQSLVVH
ncbi:MAG: Hsp70 family protein, partial [Desulfosalsimonadaceae bacterium]